MRISWMIKNSEKIPKRRDLDLSTMAKTVHPILARKWLEVSIVTYKAYVTQMRFLVIAMNAMVTMLSIAIQEYLVETRSRY